MEKCILELCRMKILILRLNSKELLVGFDLGSFDGSQLDTCISTNG